MIWNKARSSFLASLGATTALGFIGVASAPLSAKQAVAAASAAAAMGDPSALPPLNAADKAYRLKLLAGGIGWDHSMSYVAKADGYWNKYGLDVDFTYGNYGALVQAVQSGRYDAAYLNVDQAIEFASRGEHLKMVANTSFGGVELIARKDLHYTSFAGLKGLRAGINNRYNGLQVYFMENVLPAHGLQPNDLQYVVVPIPDIAEAFQRKQVDVYFLWEPTADQLVDLGVAQRILGWKETFDGGRIYRNALVLNQQFIDQHPALAKRVVWAHLDALHLIATDPDNAVRILARYGHWNAKYAALARESWNKIGWTDVKVPDSWITLTEQDLIKLGLIAKPMAPSSLVDYSFMEGYGHA